MTATDTPQWTWHECVDALAAKRRANGTFHDSKPASLDPPELIRRGLRCTVCDERLAPLYATDGRHEVCRPDWAPKPFGTRTAWDTSPSRLDQFDLAHPEAADWTPLCGWNWLTNLPDQLHRAARAAAYTACVLLVTAPVTALAPGLDDTSRAALETALVAAGLIDCHTHRGIIRWVRAGTEVTP